MTVSHGEGWDTPGDTPLEIVIAKRDQIAAWLDLPPEERTVANAPPGDAKSFLAMLDLLIAVTRRVS